MRTMILAAGLAAASLLGMPSSNVQAAPFHNPALQAPALAETVACRTVRERVERPNGRVVFRTKRICGPGGPVARNQRCRTIRERVVRPNGSVVYRSIRRCR